MAEARKDGCELRRGGSAESVPRFLVGWRGAPKSSKNILVFDPKMVVKHHPTGGLTVLFTAV